LGGLLAMKIRVDSKKVLCLMANRLLSTTDLSEITDLSYCTVNHAIKGRQISITSLGKIARALEVEPNEIAIMEV
jgi:DNA-binding Xre family transcriptional regulator